MRLLSQAPFPLTMELRCHLNVFKMLIPKWGGYIALSKVGTADRVESVRVSGLVSVVEHYVF